MTHYEEESKKNVVRLHLEEGRTLKSLADECGASKTAISKCIKTYREECQMSPDSKNDYDYMKEYLKLRKQLIKIFIV